METVQLPYKVRVQAVVIMDTLTRHSGHVKTHTQLVTAENGRQYNIFNPFAPSKSGISGVMRSSLKEALARISRNAYNTSTMLMIGNNKLAKNTNALAGFVEPLVKEVSGAFPFSQDFHLFKEDITVTVETTEGENGEAPLTGESIVKGIDKRFNDFVQVTGWPEISSGESFSEIRLTVSIKVACGEMTSEDHVELAPKIAGLMEKLGDNASLVYLMHSESQNPALVKLLVDNGAGLVTRNTKLDHMKWFPASRTAMDEKVFRSLEGQFGDFLLVK